MKNAPVTRPASANPKFNRRLLGAIALLSASGSSLYAQNLTWGGTGSTTTTGNYSLVTNWSGNTAVPAGSSPTSLALFTGLGNTTVTINSDRVARILFNSTVSYTLSGGSITTAGGGMLVDLATTNTANQTVNSDIFFGNVAGSIVLLNNNSTSNTLTLGGNIGGNAASSSGMVNALQITNRSKIVMNGNISDNLPGKSNGGPFNIQKFGGGTVGVGNLELNGNNTYTGGTDYFAGSGSFTLGHKNALGTGELRLNGSGAVINANTALTGANAIGNSIRFSGALSTIGGSTDITGVTAGSNIATVSNATGLTVGSVINYTGVMRAFPIGTYITSISGSSGSQTITLSQNALVSTNVGNGTARFQSVGSGTATTIFDGTNAIEFSGTTAIGSAYATAGTATQTFNVTNSGGVTFSGNLTQQNSIQGTGLVVGALTKSGNGTLTLSGNNTYTGVTTVTNGTLVLSGDNTGMTGGVTLSTSSGVIPRLNVNGATSLGNGTLSFGGGGASDTVRLDNGSGSPLTLTTNNAFTLNRDFNFVGSNSLNLGNMTTTIGGLSAGGNRTINVSANALTFGGAIVSSISGAGVTKSGAGTLVFSGAGSTYNGTTNINTGTMAGIGANAFGSTSVINIAGSGTLSLLGDSSTNFIKTSDSSALTVNTTAAGATINVDAATNVTTVKTMTIGALTTSSVANTWTLNLTGNNNTGLAIGAVTGPAATSNSSTGTATFNNNIGGTGTLTIASYTSTNNGTLAGAGETVSFDGAGSTVVTGAIAPGANPLSLRKNGSGTLTLSGNSTYTGTTTVNAGALVVGSTGSLASGNALTVGSGGTAEFANSGQTLGAVSNSNTATNALNFSAATGTVIVASLSGAGNTRFGSNASVTGGIASGSVTSVGALTANISGGNVGAGSLNSTSVTGGTTTVSAVATIGTMSAGTVNLNGATSAITTLNGGTINLGSTTVLSVSDGTTAGSINGIGGALNKVSAGTLTLSGTNGYTGATTVSEGTLIISGAIASTVTTVAPGAVLTFTGSSSAGNITIGSGATFALGTAGTAGVVTINDGTFSGAGTVGSLTFTGSSIFGPGNSPGTVTIADGGTLTMSVGTVSNFEITSPGFGAGTYDLVTGTAGGSPESVAFNGTLNLIFSGSGYSVSATAVKIFDVDSYSGTFSSVNVSGLDTGLVATFDSSTGYVAIAAIPEPSAYAAFAGVGMIGFALYRRRRFSSKAA